MYILHIWIIEKRVKIGNLITINVWKMNLRTDELFLKELHIAIACWNENKTET